MSVYSFSTGKIIHIPELSFGKKEPNYPSTWFASQGTKPTATVYFENQGIKALAKAVYHGLKNRNLTSNVVARYLHLALQGQKATSVTKWESYNILIAGENAEVGIFDLIEVSVEKTANGLEMDEACTEDGTGWMPFLLVCLFRLSRETNDNYRTIIGSRIKSHKQFCKIPKDFELEVLTPMCSLWQDNNLTTILSAIDMFYYRFPNEDLSFLRLGTMTCRYRGCAALTSFQRMCQVLGGIPVAEMARWPFVGAIAKNIETVFGSAEEIDKEFSYFPYQMDMGLTRRAPFSASTCSPLHFFSNAVCILLNDIQSRNARMLLEEDMSNCWWTAVLTAYAYKMYASHIVEDATDNEKAGRRTESNSTPPEPKNRDPKEWFIYFRYNGFQTTQVKEFVESVFAGLEAPRTGTIALWVKDGILRFL